MFDRREVMNESAESRELMRKMNLEYMGYGIYKNAQGQKFEYDPRTKQMKRVSLDTMHKVGEKTGESSSMALTRSLPRKVHHIGHMVDHLKTLGATHIKVHPMQQISRDGISGDMTHVTFEHNGKKYRGHVSREFGDAYITTDA